MYLPKTKQEKKEQIETKNMADSVVFQTEKLLKESGDKMKEDDKKDLEEKLEALKKVKDSDDTEDIKKKMEEMNEIAQKIGAAMYQQQGAPGAEQATDNASDATNDKKEDEEVVEGEVEDTKKDDKK